MLDRGYEGYARLSMGFLNKIKAFGRRLPSRRYIKVGFHKFILVFEFNSQVHISWIVRDKIYSQPLEFDYLRTGDTYRYCFVCPTTDKLVSELYFCQAPVRGGPRVFASAAA